MSNIIKQLEQEQLRNDIPAFAQGDTVRVQVRVIEGGKERLQAFEGVVIAKRNRGLHSSFTVRKISNGEGVERVFQTHSPLIASVELKRRGDVRRAKLYYLRNLSGKLTKKIKKPTSVGFFFYKRYDYAGITLKIEFSPPNGLVHKPSASASVAKFSAPSDITYR